MINICIVVMHDEISGMAGYCLEIRFRVVPELELKINIC